jgi:hypothetical protein
MEWILELKLEADGPKNQTPKPVLSSIHAWNHNQDFWRKKKVLKKNNYNNQGANLRLTCSWCLVLVPVIRNCI